MVYNNRAKHEGDRSSLAIIIVINDLIVEVGC